MAEEQATMPHEESPVAEKTVTESDLSSAWDKDQEPKVEQKEEPKVEEVKEEPKEEVQEVKEEVQELPDEPADNTERSRLGRRLKTIEEKFDAFLSKLETPKQPPQENVTYDDLFIQRQMEAAVERGELPATIVTPQDQYLVNRFVNNIQAQIGNQYAVNYINTLKSPQLKGDTPDDIHAEVVAELQNVESPYNLKRYNNPKIDAQINYLEAKAHILQKKAMETAPKSAFKGKPKDSPPTGTSVSTRTAPVEDDMPSLDEASLDFIKRSGMSMESVKTALKQDMPYYLRGRR